MIEILFLGFLLGMRHAFESDHVAAVASLVTRSPSVRDSIRLGSLWGLGHTVTLFIFGSAVMLLDHLIPERMAMMLEFAVGIMLVMLGIDVVHRFMRERIHFHAHRHADATVHDHAHAHGERTHAEMEHAQTGHEHMHTHRFPLRALLVGIMHGMAGSAALIVLTFFLRSDFYTMQTRKRSSPCIHITGRTTAPAPLQYNRVTTICCTVCSISSKRSGISRSGRSSSLPER